MNPSEIAENWRQSQPEHRAESGVVLIWQGAVYGWKSALRNATHERPGALAVDAHGHVFEATGGNDRDGATCWVVRN